MIFVRRRRGRAEFTPDEGQTTLVRMRAGQSGIVVQLQGGHGLMGGRHGLRRGGHGLANRLSALGIMPGKRITKISSTLMRGPVTVEIDRARVAIGFGMASRILVQLDDESTK
jgi:Fe2+ transport system protein FeoA